MKNQRRTKPLQVKENLSKGEKQAKKVVSGLYIDVSSLPKEIRKEIFKDLFENKNSPDREYKIFFSFTFTYTDENTCNILQVFCQLVDILFLCYNKIAT